MLSEIDSVAISKYVDGELELEDALRIDSRLQYDDDAKEIALTMLTARSLCQASAAKVEKEQVPPELYSIVYGQKAASPWLSTRVKQFAVLCLLTIATIGGYVTGDLTNSRDDQVAVNLVPEVAEVYRHVIDVTLENTRAGVSQRWQDVNNRSVTITPVRSYRGNNTFYRLYRLHIIDGEIESRLLCLAYRTGKQQWRNRAVFYEKTPLAI